MGREPMTPITAEVGREVCQRAGAKALLGGTIAMLGSVVRDHAQRAGLRGRHGCSRRSRCRRPRRKPCWRRWAPRCRRSARSSANRWRRFSATTRRSKRPRRDRSRRSRPTARGSRTRRMTGDFDSVPFFRRAIELDPEFALAYARLGTVYANLAQTDEARKMTARAYELRSKVSEAERYYIEARYYTTVEPDIQKALDVVSRVAGGLSERLHRARQLRAAAQATGRHRRSAAQPGSGDARRARSARLAWANLGDTYMDAEPVRRCAEDAGDGVEAAGHRRCARHPVRDRHADRRPGPRRCAGRGRARQARRSRTCCRRPHAGRRVSRPHEGSGRACRRNGWREWMRPAGARRPVRASASWRSTKRWSGWRMPAKRANGRGLGGRAAAPSPGRRAPRRGRLTSDAASWRASCCRRRSSEFKKNNGIDPQAARGERALSALAMLAEGKPAEAIALLEPMTFDGAYFGSGRACWTIAQMQVGNWPAALKGLAFMAAERAARASAPSSRLRWRSSARVQAETRPEGRGPQELPDVLRSLEGRRPRRAAAGPGPRRVREASRNAEADVVCRPACLSESSSAPSVPSGISVTYFCPAIIFL